MLPADDPTSLSLLYHLNSEPWRVPDGDWRPQYKEGTGAAVALPIAPETPLMRAIWARRSYRDFAPRELDPPDLAALLKGAYGITGIDAGNYRRAAPSAGGLYPLEMYTITRAGIAHYLTRDHALEPVASAPAPGERTACFFGQPWAEAAGAIIVLTAVFARTQAKYGPRGYRFALLEAGHVGQNICLLAEERSLAAVCLGGFVDSRLNALLRIDGKSEAALYSVAVGHPATAR
jgi:SagB-type dehydrogenase family enzyme